jgi:hypothetical protein
MTITDGLLSGGKRTVFAFGLFCLYTLSAAEETVVPSRYDEEMGVWIGDVVALTNAIKNVAASGTITLEKGIYDVSFLADAPMYGKPDKDYGAALLSSGGKQKVVIRGATGNPDDVILDGKGVFRVISLNGEVSQLRDLTVRNGRVD